MFSMYSWGEVRSVDGWVKGCMWMGILVGLCMERREKRRHGLSEIG